MYLSHFNLQENPFELNPDPKFLWLGENQKKTLEALRYGILYDGGFLVLTGEAGIGKTTMATALVDFVGDKATLARIPYSAMDPLDFFRLISTAFGISDPFSSKEAFFRRFDIFLHDTFAEGKKAVLIIDEAQRLPPGTLEELLHLAQVEENGTTRFNILFVGENEFNEVLSEESNQALRQRVAIHQTLGPLTQDETKEYILHRLHVVQCERELFTPEAIQDIFLLSQGIPRLIHVICDFALLIAYFEGGQIVRRKTIQKYMDRLRLPAETIESVRIAAGLSSRPEREADGKVGKNRFDVFKKRVRAARRASPRPLTVFAVGCALVILLMVVAIPLFRNDRARQSATRETRIEKTSQGERGTETGKEPGVAAVAPSPAKEQPLSPQMETASDPSLQREDPGKAKETKVSKKTTARDRSEKVGAQKPIARAGVSGPAEQARPDSSPQRTGSYEIGKVFPEKRESSTDEKKERVSASSRPADKLQRTETKEVDSSKAIDWLLERRPEKKAQE
jgi:type II secretory pathway predicted ATPase ExeA/chitodextrinase